MESFIEPQVQNDNITIGIYREISTIRINSRVSAREQEENPFSIVWQEISYMEGNQGELLKIKPIGATSMKKPK